MELQLKYRITSSNPAVSSATLAYTLIEQETAELESYLRDRTSVNALSVTAVREEGVPLGDVAIIIITIGGLAATAFVEQLATRLADDVYDYIRKKLTDGSIEPDD